MLLLVVPYWEVDYGNLQDFTQEGTVSYDGWVGLIGLIFLRQQAPGSLNLIPGARPPYYSTVLWATVSYMAYFI